MSKSRGSEKATIVPKVTQLLGGRADLQPKLSDPQKSFLATTLCSSVRKASHPPATAISHMNVSSPHSFPSSLPHSLLSPSLPRPGSPAAPPSPTHHSPGSQDTLTHRHLGKGGKLPSRCERGVLTAWSKRGQSHTVEPLAVGGLREPLQEQEGRGECWDRGCCQVLGHAQSPDDAARSSQGREHPLEVVFRVR